MMRDTILLAAAVRHNVPRERILSKSRKPNVVRARWWAFRTYREHGYSLGQIARWTNRHHTSVLHALRKGA